MGGHRKAPVRWQAQPGQAGNVILSHDTRAANAAALRLAKLRGLGLAGATAFTLAAIGRALNRAGMDWHDLAKRLTAPAQPQHLYHAPHPCKPPHADDAQEAMAAWLGKYRPHMLTDNQRDFVANVARMMAMGRTLSQAQVQYLRDLYHRNGGGDV